jgi:hypothetical protein
MYPSQSTKNQRNVIQLPSSEPGNPGEMAMVSLAQIEDCIFQYSIWKVDCMGD